LRALDRQRSGEYLWKNRPGAKSSFLQFFHNSSTILDSSPPRCPTRARQIFIQFFHNSSPLAVYPSKETKILRRFCGRIVEEFRACQIRGWIFLAAADLDFARKNR
jgi:hypothetical protein